MGDGFYIHCGQNIFSFKPSVLSAVQAGTEAGRASAFGVSTKPTGTNNYYFHRGGLEDSVRNAGFPVLIVNIDNRHASEPLREKEPMNVTIQQIIMSNSTIVSAI